MNDDVENLLKLTPDQLKAMNKNEVHEGYKTIMRRILFDFYLDCANSGNEIQTVKCLLDFIEKWISEHIKPPHAGWNTGDCAK